ncbi:hypothetical protein CN135_26880 [Sinorhizobium meliloti]|nr:hypothetical protein CN135_26880 [Sinorhizobium meliloti]
MQKPPDYERAVRSEFEAVRAENTVQAYERFIRRHPGHPLVGDARKAISRLQGRDGKPFLEALRSFLRSLLP